MSFCHDLFGKPAQGVPPIPSVSRTIFALFAGAVLFLLPSGLALGAPDAFSAVTVNDYLAACRTNQNNCLDAVGTALLQKAILNGATGLCLPPADYAKAVPGWLEAHAETHTMKTADGIYLALQKLYPCGGPA
jgi:hypothetical protein